MKPLRAFPFPLNIGTDICQISRIYRILSGPRASRFVSRILSPEELAKKDARLDILKRVPTKSGALEVGQRSENKSLVGDDQSHESIAARDPELWKCAAFVAGRFAAKEAAIKAHPYRRLTFHDVMIERRQVEGDRLGSGPPVARIRSGEGQAEDASALLSISHDGDYATAVCLGHEPSNGDIEGQ
ncbi:ACPS domain-containing protein [Fusarium falciforme]|uniref:ACPS domain-containing protein n=1 Tax=Fusarium falciforme TaxID=195108 RepID=UPI0023011D62|nr:ACPS domain-containing protein [Fusarium falciforme]WAO85532.1 ACPS domain-containing protein [Fusarium falciforme]